VRSGSKNLSTGDKLRLVGPIVLYAVLAFVAWKLGYFRAENVADAAQSSKRGIWAGSVFVLIYGAVAALALPVGPLAYASGAVFGFWRASILVWLGSMLGAVTGYYLARGVLAKPARRLLGRYESKLHGLRKGNVFLTALRLQLMPVIPFGPFNYAAAISDLSLPGFLVGTAVGIIPGTLIATFIGDRFIAGVHGKSKLPFFFAAATSAVVLALTFAPKLWDKSKEKAKN